MELTPGKVYLVHSEGKKARAVYCSKGGSEATGFDNHCFMLKRKQTYIRNGVARVKKYVFIKEEELESRVEV